MTSPAFVDQPSQEGDVFRDAIEGAASLWVQFAMVGLSMGAAMADTWMRGAEAMGDVLAHARAATPAPVLADEPDPWAAMRQAWATAAEPWRAWMPLLRFDVP